MLGQNRISNLTANPDGQRSLTTQGSLVASAAGEERGQAMVETVMVILILMMIILGIFDFGRIVVISASMTAAAQDAARMGAVTSNTGMIQTAALDRLILADPSQVSITVSRTSTYTEVTLVHTFRPITPFVAAFTGPSGVSLTRTARVAILGTVVPP